MNKEYDDVPVFDKSSSGSRMRREFGFGKYEKDIWESLKDDELPDDELELEISGFSVISHSQKAEDRDFSDEE